MNVRIRTETSADPPTIEALTVAAFLNAPHTSHTEQHIVNALRRAGKLAVSLVAETDDGAVIGHVAISPVSISDGTSVQSRFSRNINVVESDPSSCERLSGLSARAVPVVAL